MSKPIKAVTAQTLYKRLQSQLDGSFFHAALKTTDRRKHITAWLAWIRMQPC